ncbi:hypothetical protein OESDEN_23749 [Oesophagostomum dentatum]|uniref:MULE transposase domain-containing protein n=1 Tax=Oesophagostomum dentatum TaxID=61180 RepID=A0A0B1RYE5_OESDE|nr:hypothetical protein OESDEN_23749 [Oesophagostomum dentatum]
MKALVCSYYCIWPPRFPQLYHFITDVPLFRTLTSRKHQNIYIKVFGVVKTELLALGFDVSRLRIIFDLERPAPVGIRQHFPESCVEGCGFHLAQAWNRRALKLGLKMHMKDARVRKWWMTIKGMIFLPPHLHRRVPAFYRPSVGGDHPAHEKCKQFLEYLRENWYDGPFAGIWNKWGKKELRTSNIAESYHRVLVC